ncbi:MAG: hypothetical protein IJF02_06030 [Oscillospiraceae bacterium]|nr:hypothetical protein [Oscillospiraceae bacterium]
MQEKNKTKEACCQYKLLKGLFGMAEIIIDIAISIVSIVAIVIIVKGWKKK